jgi:hypothetical protein
MATPRVMSKLNRRASLRVVELAEHGAHLVLGVLVLGHLVEENEAVWGKALGNEPPIRSARSSSLAFSPRLTQVYLTQID